jgi:hypothetical protein
MISLSKARCLAYSLRCHHTATRPRSAYELSAQERRLAFNGRRIWGSVRQRATVAGPFRGSHCGAAERPKHGDTHSVATFQEILIKKCFGEPIFPLKKELHWRQYGVSTPSIGAMAKRGRISRRSACTTGRLNFLVSSEILRTVQRWDLFATSSFQSPRTG